MVSGTDFFHYGGHDGGLVEASVDAFRRGIGKIWPRPRKIMGKGERWLREDLDQSIDVLTMRGVKDAADVL